MGHFDYAVEIDATHAVKERTTPGWAKRFVRAVDRSRSRRITTRTARKLLREALAQGRD